MLGKLFGAGYHAPSAEDAWQRILELFDAHLRAEDRRARAAAGSPGRRPRRVPR